LHRGLSVVLHELFTPLDFVHVAGLDAGDVFLLASHGGLSVLCEARLGVVLHCVLLYYGRLLPDIDMLTPEDVTTEEPPVFDLLALLGTTFGARTDIIATVGMASTIV